jgi:hypothetical protein
MPQCADIGDGARTVVELGKSSTRASVMTFIGESDQLNGDTTKKCVSKE